MFLFVWLVWREVISLDEKLGGSIKLPPGELYLNRISLLVNDVTPDSYTPSKSVSTRSILL